MIDCHGKEENKKIKYQDIQLIISNTNTRHSIIESKQKKKKKRNYRNKLMSNTKNSLCCACACVYVFICMSVSVLCVYSTENLVWVESGYRRWGLHVTDCINKNNKKKKSREGLCVMQVYKCVFEFDVYKPRIKQSQEDYSLGKGAMIVAV